MFDDFALGAWVGTQRLNQDQLTPERREKLEHLDFVWDALAAGWEEDFGYLERYVEKHSNARVPHGHKIDGYLLGRWVSRQRNDKGQLTTERRARLGTLDGWVWKAT